MLGCPFPSAISLVDVGPGSLRHANTPAVLTPDAHARRLSRLRVDQHHVRDVDRTLGLDDAADLLRALRVAERAWTGVALLEVHALDVDPLVLGIGAEH